MLDEVSEPIIKARMLVVDYHNRHSEKKVTMANTTKSRITAIRTKPMSTSTRSKRIFVSNIEE